MNSRRLKSAGFTLVEIMIVVAIIALLVTIAIPNYVRARTTTQMNACINNLRQIEGATQCWALEKKKHEGDPVQFDDISAYLKRTVTCPATSDTSFGNSYDLHGIPDRPTCKILGTDPLLPHKLPEMDLSGGG